MEPFLGQIIMVGFNFAPRGWAFCNGQLLSIAQNTALFSLLGTTYGGDGKTTFALPDLRGRCAVGMGQGPGLSNYSQGEMAGQEHVTLIQNQIPTHTHSLTASSANGTVSDPTNAVIANNQVTIERGKTVPGSAFNPGPANVAMSPQAIGPAGGSQPHENRQPYIAMNYIIALQGIFPSRN
ncbi:phage tail protein [Parapedobacter soli]|uniref:phage tail protein n=1 Tax=Parapedobacter soli TaxID=416955 RepID=UPI0021C76306|nr:tail fiber protein [Parapedobacter soli]